MMHPAVVWSTDLYDGIVTTNREFCNVLFICMQLFFNEKEHSRKQRTF
jgi:hypothetical protein